MADRNERAAIGWDVIDALRRYGTDSSRLGHAFSALHQLQSADLQALVAIMSAERGGEPMTPGALRRHLGLSAGGTSLVIDRLERAGQVRRGRDHPTDNRVVYLRYTDHGMATGRAFFGPLGDLTNAVLDGFSSEELSIIHRFVTAAAEALHTHVADLEAQTPEPGTARPLRPGPGSAPERAQ
jgi:DNA-binding MarR family transcriptional regulator